MTASNPGLIPLSKAENQVRQTALENAVRQRGFQILAGTGEDPQGRWPPEDSILIVAVEPSDARELARMFGQWAVITGKHHERSKLLWCLDPGPDPNVLTQLVLTPYHPHQLRWSTLRTRQSSLNRVRL